MQDLAGVQISMVERCSRTVNCFELVSFPLFFALSYMNMNPVWLETCTLGGTGSMLFLHNSGGEAARGLEEAILNFSKVTMLRVVEMHSTINVNGVPEDIHPNAVQELSQSRVNCF